MTGTGEISLGWHQLQGGGRRRDGWRAPKDYIKPMKSPLPRDLDLPGMGELLIQLRDAGGREMRLSQAVTL